MRSKPKADMASLGADSPVVIDDEECVAKSFPQFMDIFEQMLQQDNKQI